MINCIVFDLDGTLVKSHKTIYKTTLKALKELNISTQIDENKFYNLLGHHFKNIFEELNVIIPDVEYFINIYKDFYFDFIDDSELYQNIIMVFDQLKIKNIKTGLLTTKGQDQAERISKHFGLSKYLDVIEGRKNGIEIKPAPDQLLKICSEFNIDPKNTLMIGDTELDILCGKNAGTKTCAVSYGYRKIEKLINHNPDYLIDDFVELLNILPL